MPEIKHQFQAGKMNKDMDERLVPNGEYRDAMNVQVATSEGSDVGTVQNILGNEKVRFLTKFGEFEFPEHATVVASISDEKVDTLYWFVHTNSADYIVSFTRNADAPIFVVIDKNKNTLKFNPDTIITGVNIIDGMLFWTDNHTEPKKINIERCIAGTIVPSTASNLTQTFLVNEGVGLGPVGSTTPPQSTVQLEEKHITVIRKTPPKTMGMDLVPVRDQSLVYTARVHVELDDGTGNTSSINYTGAQADLYNFNAFHVDKELWIKIEEDVDGNTLGNIWGSTGMTGWQTGPTGSSSIEVGTKLVIGVFDDVDDPPGIPLTDFSLKCEIVNVHNNAVKVVVTSRMGNPPEPDATIGQTELQFAVDLFDETEKLFEFKLPRFSYRYKYEDGEYSPFAPFTQVAFIPGSFDYHPRKGYNIGMTNTIEAIKLSRFLDLNTPKDVVSVDILFKDEPSPVIYVVDTIRPTDYPPDGADANVWDIVSTGGEYVISKETVNNVVPSNQLLRPWDNVPRKALAQDITGSRIVYANYTQNYNMHTSDGKDYYADFKTNWSEFDAGLTDTGKSCKSLREYQLGVVFIDKYGRETPVISNPTGTMKLDKGDALKNNRIRVGLKGNVNEVSPTEMEYFKFFVKETANEYYNMAMDRWYIAEDNNVWLSFPSTERNKLDLDSFLILKKGSDQDYLVTEPARYKVLAIENEAPDFIKTKPLLISEETHFYPVEESDGTVLYEGNPIFAGDLANAPLQGATSFKILYNKYKASPARDLHNYIMSGLGHLYIEFGLAGEEEMSSRYKIASITCDYNQFNPTGNETFNIKLDKPLGPDVNLISDDPTGIDPEEIVDGAIVRFYKYEVLDLPQFDGRFFTKIYMDDVFTQNIEKTFDAQSGYRIIDQETLYLQKEDYFEQFTSHMGWWFTPSFQDTKRAALASPYEGSRNHVNGSQSYGYDPAINGTLANGYSGGYYFGNIWRLLSAHSVLQFVDGNTTIDNYELGSNPNCYDVFYRQNRYGHYGNDKYAASYIWFRRFLPAEVQGDGVVQNATSHEARANLRWQTCYHNGGDKRDAANWTKISYGDSEACAAVGNNFKAYDQSGNPGWIEWCSESAGEVGGISTSNCYNNDAYYNATRDAEVWFCDDGRVVGQRTTNNSLQFNNNDHSTWGPTSVLTGNQNGGIHVNDMSCNKSGPAGGPQGAHVWSSEKWNMNLGFGGIFGKTGVQKDVGDDLFGIGAWNGETSNPEYADIQLNKFVGRINPGYKFKFREDPTQTIYTLSSKIKPYAYLNHSAYDGRETDSGYPGKEHYRSISHTNMDPSVSFNMKRSWRCRDIKPSLQGNWNPFVEGEIPGGVKLDLKIVDTNGTTNDTLNKVIGSQWVPDGDNVSIFVETLKGDCQNGNGIRVLHEGMCLKSWEDQDGTTRYYGQVTGGYQTGDQGSPNSLGHPNHAGNDYLVVRRIIPHPNAMEPEYYQLWLGGYNFPMQNADHSWFDSTTTFTHPTCTDSTGVANNYQFVQLGMNGHNANTEFNINENGYDLTSHSDENGVNNQRFGKMGAVGYTLQFVEEIAKEETLSENPAIWETEPKESKGLDIYHEATGAIPFNVTKENIHEAFPIGTAITTTTSTTILYVTGYHHTGPWLYLDDEPTTPSTYTSTPNTVNISALFISNSTYHATTPSGLTFNFVTQAWSSSEPNAPFHGTGANGVLKFKPSIYNADFKLPWFNCYSFGNGVESNRIRDNYNQSYISNGVKASTTLETEYKEEHRKYGLIYSGIYNSTSGFNTLNQFIQAEKITKDVNPIYGSIQKLHARDSDLIALCEDKILRIQSNKDTLFNADGSSNVTSSDKVLGQTTPFSGEYGISTNPESFASEAYRAYFSDRVRGKVMRLSRDGLTPISDYGMKDWFRDHFKLVGQTGKVLGSYDDRNDEYNVKLEQYELVVTGDLIETTPKVAAFSEKVKGWISFKSFTQMSSANSMANSYYTFYQGNAFKHYSENVDRNTFYGIGPDQDPNAESSLTVILNDNPHAVKVYNTLNYEGSQSKVDQFTSAAINAQFQPTTTYNDQTIYNLQDKDGWYVDNIITNKEEGSISEFIEKEGKWFNNINRTIDVSTGPAGTADFTFQGVGVVNEVDVTVTPLPDNIPCPIPFISTTASIQPDIGGISALNFNNPAIMATDPYDSYILTVTPPTGVSQTYNSLISGNLFLHSFDYNELLVKGDGEWFFSITYIWNGIGVCTQELSYEVITGCLNTDVGALGMSTTANVHDQNACVYISGCMDPAANNYDPTANINDAASCAYPWEPSDQG
jgi:hypothetical protein